MRPPPSPRDGGRAARVGASKAPGQLPSKDALGELYLLLAAAQVRATQSPDSPLVTELPKGSPCRLVEAQAARKLVRIYHSAPSTGEAIAGWVRAAGDDGTALLQRVTFGLGRVPQEWVDAARTTSAPGRGVIFASPDSGDEAPPAKGGLQSVGSLFEPEEDNAEKLVETNDGKRNLRTADSTLSHYRPQDVEKEHLAAKAAANKELDEAIDDSSVPRLRAAVQQAEAVGLSRVEVARGKTALEALEKRQVVLSRLLKDVADVGIGQAAALLQQAQDDGLATTKEWRDAVRLLRRRIEAKDKELSEGMDALESALEETEEWELARDQGNLDKLEGFKKELASAVELARKCNMPETEFLPAVESEFLADFKLCFCQRGPQLLREADRRRKQIHNAVEDLKGKIRVFCRVRPLSYAELERPELSIVTKSDAYSVTVELSRAMMDEQKKQLELRKKNLGKGEKAEVESWVPEVRYGDNKPQDFTFDSVFHPGTQDDVFADCKDLIQSALDGFNVTTFAYGQTGAGKTHTMLGTQDTPGIAPRAVEELFKCIQRDEARYDHEVFVSIFELYKSEFVDLMSDDRLEDENNPAKGNKAAAGGVSPSKTPTGGAGGNSKRKAAGRGDWHGHQWQPTVHLCRGLDEERPSKQILLDLMAQGTKNRHVSATHMNAQSSRSHLIITIHVHREKIRVQESAGILRQFAALVDARLEGGLEAVWSYLHKSVDEPLIFQDLSAVCRALQYEHDVRRLHRVLTAGGSRPSVTFEDAEPLFAEARRELLEKEHGRHVAGSAAALEQEQRDLHGLAPIDCVESKITLCDLAGSERLKRSGATGELAEESIAINKSLSNLGNVLRTLGKVHGSKPEKRGQIHVPYHDDKLTEVLMDALGGNSKTLMFVHVSPALSNFEETKTTLKFGMEAKIVQNDHQKNSVEKRKMDRVDNHQTGKRQS